MRSYEYNQSDLQQLYATIIEWLSDPDIREDTVQRILVNVCEHFKFGCGFIYETDHTRTFHLKESHTSYETAGVQDSFKIESHLTPDELEELLQSKLFYLRLQKSRTRTSLTRIFDSNSFMMVPVLDQKREFIGLVGMMDRRRNILLDDQAINATKTVLNLIANQVKLRCYQRNIEYARESLTSTLDNTGIDVYVTDYNTHEILYVNKSMAAPYGGLGNMLGKKCWQILYNNEKSGPCDYCPKAKLIDENGNPTKTYSWDYCRPFDRSWFRVLSSAFHWVDGRLAHVVTSVDITENKNNEATIAHLANYDPLTNLPNRRKFIHDCGEMLAKAAREKSSCYLLFFDLDNFKKLNDSMGHQAGDELLAKIGSALQEDTLTANHCYRHGGDEFVLLYERVDRTHIIKVVKFLLRLFNRPWRLSSANPLCRASIGIAGFPEDGNNANDLLHHADDMMYKAKELGRGLACFCDGDIIRPDLTRIILRNAAKPE